MTDVAQSGRWMPGMPSPNPAGRPKGISDRRQKLQNAFADDGVAIIRVVIDKALGGDMQAAQIALARIAPPLKAQSERVQFELSNDLPPSEQAREVLRAVSEGNVNAETGKVLIGCIQAVSNLRAIEELERRITILEEKAL